MEPNTGPGAEPSNILTAAVAIFVLFLALPFVTALWMWGMQLAATKWHAMVAAMVGRIG